jgi:hypothetical protein
MRDFREFKVDGSTRLSELNRVQERIPLVKKIEKTSTDQPSTRQLLRLRVLVLIAVLVSTAPLHTPVQGQEGFYGSSSTGIETTASWPWWHRLYYSANGSPRYGKGFANMARNHEYRLPVNPPICGPSFGYYQPCWRQVPLVRRCVTCETLQPDREVPTSNRMPGLSPTPIPPAPEASIDQEPGHSDPDAPAAAPIP